MTELALESMVWTLTGCAPWQKPIVRVEGVSSMKEEPREVTLLKAAWMLLNKQKDSFYVLNLLTETVFYDGADCDGYCLSDDILDYLLDKGIDPQAEG